MNTSPREVANPTRSSRFPPPLHRHDDYDPLPLAGTRRALETEIAGWQYVYVDISIARSTDARLADGRDW